MLTGCYSNEYCFEKKYSEYTEMSYIVVRVGYYVLYLTETTRDGDYMAGDILFTSQTNRVVVIFTSA